LYEPPASVATKVGATKISDQVERIGEDRVASTYLEALSGNGSSLKSSYSPFGLSKSNKFAPSSDDLYIPLNTLSGVVSTQYSKENEDIENQVEETEFPDTSSSTDSGVNYLDTLVGSVSSFFKRSFSPFGSSEWDSPTTSNILYCPPATATATAEVNLDVARSDISDFSTTVEGDRILTAYTE
jgi:hypothetical protein